MKKRNTAVFAAALIFGMSIPTASAEEYPAVLRDIRSADKSISGNTGAAYAKDINEVFLTLLNDRKHNKADADAHVSEPVFSQKGGFYDAPFTLKLSGGGAEILYTLDGSDPKTSKTAKIYKNGISVYNNTKDPNVWSTVEDITLREYYSKPNYPIDKGIVVRAAAKDKNGNFSQTVSHSYFIGKTKDYYRDLKVISLTTDGDNLFNDETGIYMVGSQYYKWRNSTDFDPKLDPGSNENPTNYNSSGKEWEIPAAIQVFENGTTAYSANVGVRINGNWTRSEAQKSFRIYARKEYGSSKLEYEFIDGLRDTNGKKIKKFDKILLRNGGNDFGQLGVRDAFIQSLCKDRAVGVQGYEPCVVFVNGEFWGRYNIRERIDEYYLADHYGVDKDNVTILKNYETDGDESLSYAFHKLCDWGATADMTKSANYKRVCDEIDVQSLMDLIAIETYVNNNDFVPPTYINNFLLWRVNKADKKNTYADGKWRFVLCDLDMSAGMYHGTETAADYDLLGRMNTDLGAYYNFIPMFYNLLNNDDFRKEFEQRYTEIVKKNFNADKVISELNAESALCRDVMRDTYDRFNMHYYDYDREMKHLKDYFRRRPEYATRYLKALLEK